MNTPKRHHFVPQWLMKHWSHDGKSVRGIDRRDRYQLRPFRSNVTNINVQRDLYTYERSDGSKDARLESDFYAALDDRAARLTAELITILECGDLPVLPKRIRILLWQFYIYNAKKRLPDILDPYLERLDHEKLRDSTIQDATAKGYDPDEVKREVAALEFDKNLSTLIIQKVRASQSEEVLETFGKTGVRFLIAPEGASFILPDDAINLITAEAEEKKPLYVPISPKYAISPNGQTGECVRTDADKQSVRSINEQWYRRSRTVISTSEQLLKSLAKKLDGRSISFN